MKTTWTQLGPEELSGFSAGSTVELYWNIHRQTYSVRQGGRVICYADSVALANAQFRVGAAGRDRVRREGRKNVHAYVTGQVIHFPDLARDPNRVNYNPRKNETFVDRDGNRVDWAAEVILTRAETPDGRRPWRPVTVASGTNVGGRIS